MSKKKAGWRDYVVITVMVAVAIFIAVAIT
jgi:hypothetical protein